MPNLNNKGALITGAGRGTGQAIALALAQAGARVAVVDVNPDAAQRTADLIAAAGGAAAVYVADVTNKMGVQTMLYEVLDAWGQIDILVNAAHVTPSRDALKMDEWEWNRTLDTNLKGAFLVAQTVARAMTTTGGGLILNVLRAPEASSHAAVRAAQEGLLGLTGALKAEWAAVHIRVESLSAAANAAQAAAEAVQKSEAFFTSQ